MNRERMKRGVRGPTFARECDQTNVAKRPEDRRSNSARKERCGSRGVDLERPRETHAGGAATVGAESYFAPIAISALSVRQYQMPSTSAGEAMTCAFISFTRSSLKVGPA